MEDYQEEYTYSVFHGVLSYVKLDGCYVLPDTLISKESSAATKNTPAAGSVPIVKAWSFLSKRGDKPVDKMRVDTSKGSETVNYETCATWVKFFYDRLSDNAESEDKQRSGVFSKAFAVKATSLVMINMIRLMTKEEYDVGLHIQTQTRERFVNLLGAPSSALPKCSTFAPPSRRILTKIQRIDSKSYPLSPPARNPYD